MDESKVQEASYTSTWTENFPWSASCENDNHLPCKQQNKFSKTFREPHVIKQLGNNVSGCCVYFGALLFWRPRRSFVYLKLLRFFPATSVINFQFATFGSLKISTWLWAVEIVSSFLFPICATRVTCVLRPCFISIKGLLKSEKLDGQNS